jgi:hypothetical protein
MQYFRCEASKLLQKRQSAAEARSEAFMSRLTLSTLLAAALLATTTAPLGATTDTRPVDRLSFMTFSRSVQIPGAVLDAGTYRFRLADPTSGRQVMQVLSNDGSIVYSMFYTRQDWRNKVTDDTTVTFRETPAGAPAAVRSLFYGGETRGYEFVYKKGELSRKPVVTPAQPPVTYTPMPVAAPPPIASEPAPAFTETTPAPWPAAPALAPEEATYAESAAAPAELPKTASPVPMAAIGGLLTLLAGLGAGLLRSRT